MHVGPSWQRLAARPVQAPCWSSASTVPGTADRQRRKLDERSNASIARTFPLAAVVGLGSERTSPRLTPGTGRGGRAR